MLEILSTYGGPAAGVAGAIALILAQIKTNSTRAVTAQTWQAAANSWKEEAEAQKARADRVIGELEGVKQELEGLKHQTQMLIAIISTIDPVKLEEIRITRGL
ncbi:hypothetical protein OIE82_27075 [Streptomyces althioticus]|jgi:hypothetical protein|uniref:Holin n=1 Tax=Streptomyces althioticus TaxID=83380 RepID=A0ABZ1YBD8_9ACTN